ncbi:hypothetical protein [Saltatorellus ferox]
MNYATTLASLVLFALPVFGQVEEGSVYSIGSVTQGYEAHLGLDLDVSGDRAIARSRERLGDQYDAGVVYFLKLEDGRWEVEQLVSELPGGLSNFQIVAHLAIDGHSAAVAAQTQVSPGIWEYQLYMFEYSEANGWELTVELEVPRIDGFKLVGHLDLEGDILIMQARETIVSFERRNGVWRRIGNIYPDIAPFLNFVSFTWPSKPVIYGGKVYTRYRALNLGPQSPQVHVFSRLGGRWTVSEIFTVPFEAYSPYSSTGLIYAADVDGEWYMSCALDSCAGCLPYVTVYKRRPTDGRFEYHSRLGPNSSFPTTPHTGDQFGASIDIESGRVVIGAPLSGNVSQRPVGRAYVFEYDAVQDAWIETRVLVDQRLMVPSATTYGSFGWNVALHDGGIIASNYLGMTDNGELNSTGSLHFFPDAVGTTSCQGTLSPQSEQVSLSIDGSTTPSAGGIRLTGSGLPPFSPLIVLASTQPAAINLPGGSGEQFCTGSPRLQTGGFQLALGDGTFETGYDLSESPFGTFSAGETLHFQLWFRTPTSWGQSIGLSNAVSFKLN